MFIVAYIGRHLVELRTKFDRNRTILGENIEDLASFRRVMSQCDLDLLPRDLECLLYFEWQMIRLYAEFERNRTIRG